MGSKAFRRALVLGVVSLSLASPAGGRAEPVRPFSVTGAVGVFSGQGDEWEQFDGERFVTGRIGAGVRLWPLLELGADLSVWHAQGEYPKRSGWARQDLTVVPVQVFALVPLAFSRWQPVVPYFGGGCTLYDYRHRVRDVGETHSNRLGYNLRAGVRVALEAFFPELRRMRFGRGSLLALEFVQAGPFQRDDGPPLLGRSLLIGPVVEF